MTNISTAWKTDKGPRPANEDSCLILTRDELAGAAEGLLVVADGMGGRASGATASGLAVEAVRRTFTSGVQTASDLGSLLSRSLVAANTDVVREAGARPELQGMGTTCVAAAVKDDKLFVAHVGDSRGYLLRDGRLTQLPCHCHCATSLVHRLQPGTRQGAKPPQTDGLALATRTIRSQLRL